MKKRNPKLLIAGLILVAGLSILFLVTLQDFLRTVLLEPLIKGYCIIRWYVLRLPQLLLWVILVLIATYLLLRAYIRAFGSLSQPRTRWVHTSAPASHLEELTEAIGRAQGHSFSRQRLASDLASLAVQMIAHREGLSLEEARTRFDNETWCDKPAVTAFFRYLKQRYGLKRGKNLNTKLQKTILFLERYHQGV